MGFIRRALENKTNQQLAAAVIITTKLSNSQVVGAIKAIVHDLNTEFDQRHASAGTLKRLTLGPPAHRHYAVVVNERDVQLYYGLSDKELKDRKRSSQVSDFFRAEIRFKPRAENGDVGVQIHLAQWTVGSQSGRMGPKENYIEFTDRFHEVLTKS